MPEILQIGPFMVRMDWLILAVAGCSGYAAMQWRWKRSNAGDIPVLEPLWNALFIVFLIWKLSPLFLSPSLLREPPLYWITVPGTSAGWWIGIAIAALYVYLNLKKRGASWSFFGDLLAFGCVISVFVYNLLGWQHGTPTTLPWGISIENPEYKYHPVNIYRLLITLPMLVWFWRYDRLLGTGQWLSNSLTYYGMGLMVVSFFSGKTEVLFGLSSDQVGLILLMLFGVGMSFYFNYEEKRLQKKKDDKESKAI